MLLIFFLSLPGSGELEFEEFVTLAARFLVEEDAEAMQDELREAFRLYDKEGEDSYSTYTQASLRNETDNVFATS